MKAQSPATLSSTRGFSASAGEQRVRADQVQVDGVPLEEELGRHDDGNVAVAAGGHEVAEAVGFDEGTPFRLTEGGVNRGDVHPQECGTQVAGSSSSMDSARWRL